MIEFAPATSSQTPIVLWRVCSRNQTRLNLSWQNAPLSAISTPVKHKRSGAATFAILSLAAQDDYRKHARDMEGSFIGPMPVEKFFEAFMNPAPLPRPEGTINFEPADTGSYETAFVDAVNNSAFAPGLTFVNTKDKPDTQFSSLRKPDISTFRADPETVPAAAPRDRVHWNKTELYLEVKPRDAFIKNPASSVTPDARKELDVAAAGDSAAEIREQLIS
ncbi:hypothetical protein FA95DRAFT_966743, partial [Auriscalpium vulgare]